ncbi:hypothetical protein AB0F17_34235 [Nonomuraea sp. NPDC026600]|uniref:hypothetical protein n=1 Tax=Nonomuraea sp. NPDC026600 TaxID=3155363 RepID=UPI0033EE11AF
MINELLLTGFVYLLGAVTFAVVAVFTVVCTTCSDLIKQEAATRLERLPLWLLHRMARDLPDYTRQRILDEQLIPDLLYELRSTEGLPLTRLVRGTMFAVHLSGGPAVAVGKMLKRSPAPALATTNNEPAPASADLTPSPVLPGRTYPGQQSVYMSHHTPDARCGCLPCKVGSTLISALLGKYDARARCPLCLVDATPPLDTDGRPAPVVIAVQVATHKRHNATLSVTRRRSERELLRRSGVGAVAGLPQAWYHGPKLCTMAEVTPEWDDMTPEEWKLLAREHVFVAYATCPVCRRPA